MNTKVTIAIPSNRRVSPQTTQSVLDLITRGGYDFHLIVASEGYTIAENRNYIAVQALNAKSDYLLMADDDMSFEPETLDKLIKVGKDICGVAYHPRADTPITKYTDETHFIKLEENTDPKYKKPFKCHATGTGIILIKVDVFKKVPRPWFFFEWFDSGQCKQGEDWGLCIKAKEYGIETWCDPTIVVGHWGEKII